jgi:hypothetical protein
MLNSRVGTYHPATAPTPDEVRRWLDSQPKTHALSKAAELTGTQAAINAALKTLPKGRRGAVVMHGDVRTRAITASVFGRKPGRFFGLLPPGEWSYVGTVGFKSGRLDGSAAVAYAW